MMLASPVNGNTVGHFGTRRCGVDRQLIPLAGLLIIDISSPRIRINTIFYFLPFTRQNIRFHNGFIFLCRKGPDAVFIFVRIKGIHIQIRFVVRIGIYGTVLRIIDQGAVEICRSAGFLAFFITEPVGIFIPEQLIPMISVTQIIKMIYAQIAVVNGNAFMNGFTGNRRIVIPRVRIRLPGFALFVIAHKVRKFGIFRLRNIEISAVVFINDLVYFHRIVPAQGRHFFRINNLAVLFYDNPGHAVLTGIRNMELIPVILK